MCSIQRLTGVEIYVPIKMISLSTLASSTPTCIEVQSFSDFGQTLDPVVDYMLLKIDRGGQPNSRQREPEGEVPDL